MAAPSRFPADLGCMLLFFFALFFLIPMAASVVVPNLVHFIQEQRKP